MAFQIAQKEEYKAELEAQYVKAVLDRMSKHLRNMQGYDILMPGFILHCMKELFNNGKLNLATKEITVDYYSAKVFRKKGILVLVRIMSTMI
jgi:hypothetical protein